MTEPATDNRSTPQGGQTVRPLWLVLVAGSIITALSLGVRSTFGLFLDPVVGALQTGRGAFALAIAIQNLLWGLSQPIAGAIADRYGAARVLSAGAVLYALGLVIMSSAESTGTLYLSTGFIIGVGTGAASFAVVLAAIGRMASPEKRSMALGIASAMGSVGQFVLVPVIQRIIDNRSWESAALLLAVVILGVIVCAPALRGRAADFVGLTPGGQPSEIVPLRQELRRAGYSRSYRLLNLAFFVCGFHVTFIATHLISHAEDLGQERSIGSTALALIGLFNIAGSLAAGALGGRYSKTKLLAGIYFMRAVVITAYMLVPASPATTVAFGAAIGVLWLSTVPLTSGIVASQFGTAHAGTLFGIVFLSHQVGAFAGAWMGGTLADRAGSYDPVWWIAAALGIMAAVSHLFIDEGPQPEPPAAVTGLPAPAGGVAALLLVTGLTVGSLASARAAAADDGADSGTDQTSGIAYFCPLHPAGLGN